MMSDRGDCGEKSKSCPFVTGETDTRTHTQAIFINVPQLVTRQEGRGGGGVKGNGRKREDSKGEEEERKRIGEEKERREKGRK